MYARANNDGASQVSVMGAMGLTTAPATGKDQSGYTVGIRHTF
jgi:hypothetical protein